ncbi:MAG: hypothetical protein WA948_02295, partial [Pontixanthobacter sp.]
DAHATMIRLLVSARLLAPQLQPPTPAACARLATACGFTDMDALLNALTHARSLVAAEWARVFEHEREGSNL